MLVSLKDIPFDPCGNPEPPVLILKTLGDEICGPLGNYGNLHFSLNYNDVSEISFEVPAPSPGNPSPLYSKITGMKIVEARPFGKFILMNPEISGDGVKESKKCKGYSLEYEFNHQKIYIPSGTYNFYNPAAPGNTIVGIIRELMPNWSVGTIDARLLGKYRTFDLTEDNLFSFLMNTLQKAYNCLFVFDTGKRIFHVKSADSGAKELPIYLSYDNLLKSTRVTELTDNIVTALEGYGADPVTIASVNPLGTNTIYNLDYFIENGDLPETMAEKWTLWKENLDKNQAVYENLNVAYDLELTNLLTAKAKLTQLNEELEALNTLHSTIVAGLLIHTSTQQSLDQCNADIAAQKAAIRRQEQTVEAISASAESLDDQRRAINQACRFEAFFTQDEILILKRYFKVSSVKEDTFVLTNTDYKAEDMIRTITGGSLSVKTSDTNEIRISDALTRRTFDFRGGTIALQDRDDSLKGDIVSMTMDLDTKTHEFLLSCFLNTVKINDDSFPSANLSLKGTLSDFHNTRETISFSMDEALCFVTRGVTQYQQQIVSKELYDYVSDTLRKLACPSCEFSVESGNFLFAREFQPFRDALELGCAVILQLSGGLTVKPILLTIELDYEKATNFSLVFSNKFTRSDAASSLVDLIGDAITTAGSVDLSKFNYSAYLDSSADTQIRDFITGGLDVAKNAILSSSGQSINWDSSGIHLRKTAESGGFEPEQIRMINNCIAFTDDGWDHASMAIGKFTDKNLGTVYGAAAPALVGTLLAGENLVIENLSPDGKHMQFKVDSSGAYLNNSQFLLQSDQGGQVALDPSFGLAIGGSPAKPLYNIDHNGRLRLNTDNANFYTDLNGNLVMKGKVYATDGEFTGMIHATSGLFEGTVKASDYLDSKGNKMFINDKFQADYLELKGLNVNDNFIVDEFGRVTINNGSISWGAVTGTEEIDNRITNAQDAADDAASDAAYAEKIAKQIAAGTYSGGTFIDGRGIYSPKIYANEFNVYPESSGEGSFNIYGTFGNLMHMLQIKYTNSGSSPNVVFKSPVNAYAEWVFGQTHFSGKIDFSGATVSGLNVTARFA